MGVQKAQLPVGGGGISLQKCHIRGSFNRENPLLGIGPIDVPTHEGTERGWGYLLWLDLEGQKFASHSNIGNWGKKAVRLWNSMQVYKRMRPLSPTPGNH